MLTGTVAGGVIAQATNLGVPYILRIVMLGLTFIVAWILMHDLGFTPRKRASVKHDVMMTLKASYKHGLSNPPVRWVMLAAPFGAGVGFYAFYAMQPYLLELYGKSSSYAIAGLAAAIVAGAQIAGGFLVPHIRRLFRLRTQLLFTAAIFSGVMLALIGIVSNFWVVLAFLVIWGVIFAAASPVRQAYLNGLIPSAQRATVLSSDNLLGSSGAVVIQPVLGKVADVWSYSTSYLVGAIIYLFALPFILLAKKEHASSDPIKDEGSAQSPPPPEAPIEPVGKTK